MFDYCFDNISCFFVLLLFLRDKLFLASNLNSSGRSHVDLLFINEEQEKVGASDVYDSFASMPTVFMMSLIHSAGRKVATLMVVFKRRFVTN